MSYYLISWKGLSASMMPNYSGSSDLSIIK
uniref:Uncharacterized protein n=1 Tax=Arundo donax TaxID=35708 RepID=A0A0A9H1G1_ARUDO